MNFNYDLVVAYRVYPKFSNAYLKISHEAFKDVFKDVDFYFITEDLKGLENVASFLIQTKLLSEQNLSSLVLFQEDDYFYINKLNYAIDFLK